MRRLPTLDGWRAVAIAAVIASHSAFLFDHDGVLPSAVLRSIASNLRLGVDLFFAISGFLITYRLVAEWQQRGQVSLSAFYVRRAFRILPPYATYLACIGCLAALGVLTVRGWEFWSSITFVRNYWMGVQAGAVTNHLWSLAVEEHFYLLWPLALVLLRPKAARWAAPAAALAVHLWRAVDSRYNFFAHALSYPPDAGVLFRSDTRMDALLWGCFAALVYPQIEGLARRFTRHGSIATLAVLSTIVCAIIFRARMLPLLLAILFPMLIVSTVALPGSRLARCLEWRFMRHFGALSYSIYLWQTLFLQTGASFNLRSGAAGWQRSGYWLLDLGSIGVLAYLSFYLVEQPMIARGREIAGAILARDQPTP